MKTLSSRIFQADFDKDSGAWLGLKTRRGDPVVLLGQGAGFDIQVDGKPWWGSRSRQASGFRYFAEGRGGAFIFEESGLRLTHSVELDAALPMIYQSVHIEVLSGPDRKLNGVTYILPGLRVNDPASCRVFAPGQALPPGIPYPQAAALPLDRSVSEPSPAYPQGWLESAPDQSPGIIAIENVADGRVVSCWLHSEQATTFPTLDGRGDVLDVAHYHHLEAWLKPDESVVSQGLCVMLSEGSLLDHLAKFRQAAYEGAMDSAEDVPPWLAQARLLQIDPYPISKWTARLDEVARLGFNVLYLMPVWANQEGHPYAIHDHYAIDPSVGSVDDLQEFVRQAHRLNLKVLFDFIPQGVGDSSSFIERHPDWLVRDDQGRPFGSHGWGPKPGEPPNGHTYSLDWGRSDYRQYAVAWALWNVETFDIDGFRTDALHWKEGNFDPNNTRPAWRTAFGGVRLAAELREELKEAKPDTVLLSELWGPIFQRSHDASYINGWFAMQRNLNWLTGQPTLTAREYQQALVLDEAARPGNFLRANFTANHDLQHVSQAARVSPLGNAVSFLYAFSKGFPFVTWSELEGREDFFAGLMAARHDLTGYEADHAAALADHADVFTALWTKHNATPLLAVVNLSQDTVNTFVALPHAIENVPVQRYGCEGVSVTVIGQNIAIHLPAGGYALIEV
jgi:hypothetical protein